MRFIADSHVFRCMKHELDALRPKSAAPPGQWLSSVPGETEAERNLRMQWFRDAKFGMFVHWGLFAVPGGYHRDQHVAGRNVPPFSEWLMFTWRPAPKFLTKSDNPVLFVVTLGATSVLGRSAELS